MEVINPFTGEAFDSVPMATVEDVEMAVRSAERGAKAMRALTAYDRYELLMRVVEIMKARKDDFGRTITREEGKIIGEGLMEADRAIQTMTWSAEEAKRLYGEVIPLDAAPGNEMKFGFTIRVPVGVVVAIAPFNFPLNLVAHKVGPAIAAGNSGRHQAGKRHPSFVAQVDRSVPGSRPAAGGHPMCHRFRSIHR